MQEPIRAQAEIVRLGFHQVGLTMFGLAVTIRRIRVPSALKRWKTTTWRCAAGQVGSLPPQPVRGAAGLQQPRLSASSSPSLPCRRSFQHPATEQGIQAMRHFEDHRR